METMDQHNSLRMPESISEVRETEILISAGASADLDINIDQLCSLDAMKKAFQIPTPRNQEAEQRWPEIFFSNLRDLRNNKKMCDVVLITRNSRGHPVEFAAHSLVLMCSSPYLRSEMETLDPSQFPVSLDLIHISATGLETVLDYIYGEVVTVKDGPQCMNTKVAAGLLGVLTLHNLLEDVDESSAAEFPFKIKYNNIVSRGKKDKRGSSAGNGGMVSRGTQATDDLVLDEDIEISEQDSAQTNERDGIELGCPYCSREFSNKVSYLTHLACVHPHSKGEFWFACDQCQEVFLKCSQLIAHARSHEELLQSEMEMRDEEPQSKGLKKRSPLPLKYGNFLCSECGLVFLSNVRFKQHMTYHNVHSSAKAGKKMKHECPICDLAFRNKKDMREHVICVHTDQQDHICEICSKSFATRRLLKSHRKYKHHAHMAKVYYCMECEKGFATAQNLRAHTSVHAQEKQLHCGFCGLAFKRMYELKRHRKNSCRAHTKNVSEEIPESFAVVDISGEMEGGEIVLSLN